MYKKIEINDAIDIPPPHSPQKSRQIEKHFANMNESKMSGTMTQGFFNKSGYENEEEYISPSKKQKDIGENNQQNMSPQNAKRRRTRRQIKEQFCEQLRLDPMKQKQKVDVFLNVHIDKGYEDEANQKVNNVSKVNNISTENNENGVTKRRLTRRQNEEKQKEKPVEKVESINKNTASHIQISITKNAEILFADQQDDDIIQESGSKNVVPPIATVEHTFDQSDENEQPQPIISNYFNFSNLTVFKNQIYHQLQNNQILNMEIIRNKGGFNTFWPEFHLQFKNDSRYIISAKRTSSKPTSTFIISASRTNFEEDSEFYLGKMTSNMLGNVMNISTSGLSMADSKKLKLNPRQILATIVYNSSLFQVGKPRQFYVYVKKQEYKYYNSFKQVSIQNDDIPLNKLYQSAQNHSKINVYHNRKPVWQEQIGGYMLNFKGKVDCPSIKNFILEQEFNGSDLIIFGKSHNQRFNIDVKGPLSPFVAFAIALSSFDSRIMCE